MNKPNSDKYEFVFLKLNYFNKTNYLENKY